MNLPIFFMNGISQSYLCQNWVFLSIAGGLDFFLVDFYAVVQIQLNAAQGQMGDHLVIVTALLELLLQFLLPLGGGGHLPGILAVVDHVLHPADFRLVDSLHLVEVVHPEVADGVRRVAVEVDQRLEAVLLAAVKEPVDGPLLVGFAVVLATKISSEGVNLDKQAFNAS